MRGPNESVAEYNQRIAAEQRQARGGNAERFGNWLGNELRYWGGQLIDEATKPVDRGPLGPQVPKQEPKQEPAAKTTDRSSINPNYSREEVASNKAAVDELWRKQQEAASKDESSGAGPAPTTTRTNSNNVTQQGKNLSAIRMPGLEELSRYAGTNVANFAGPSFPTQPASNKITDGYPATSGQQFPMTGYKPQYQGEIGGASLDGRPALKPTGVAFEDSPNLNIADRDAVTATNKPGGPFAGPPTATTGLPDPNQREVNTDVLAGVDAGIRADGGTPPKRQSGQPRAKMSDALSDTDGISSYMSKFRSNSPENQELRRRAAFLDSSPDSMIASKAVNAGLGGVSFGDKALVNVDGQVEEMSASDWRAYRNASAEDAQGMKDKWVKALRSRQSETPAAPSAKQNPTEDSGTADFPTDVPESARGIADRPSNAPTSYEFDVNNDEDDLDLSRNGGSFSGMGGQFNLNPGYWN